MNYDDDTRMPLGFEIDRSASNVKIPMGYTAFVQLLREWRSKDWSAKQIMDALKQKGVKGIEQKNIESFLAG